ncbi:lactonase family protein [Ralstonia pickettii]|nr:lactonase family protein [Ralstonia pickettii]
MAKKTYDIFVGCYGNENEETIHWLEFDALNGKIYDVASFSGVENPSYLTVDHKRNCLYVISEKERGEVLSFEIDRQLKTINLWNRFPAKGGPCYIELGEDGDYLFTANYGGGSVIVHQLNQKGEIEKETDFKKYHPEISKLHTIRRIPGTSMYVATDLGWNKIYFYRFLEELGRLEQIKEIDTPGSSGPRHLAFHPFLNMLYVVNEFDSTILAYSYDALLESVRLEQTITTLPSNFNGENYGAEIHFFDGYVYVSNRGHHSIAVFKVLQDGKLEALSHTNLTGKWPRHFTCLPNSDYIVVANERSNELIVMEREEGGKLKITENYFSVKSPVCIQFLA